ncbi:MAG: hypothetical protein H0X39_09220 [Actinobacteria bacterium]|nr:hypothetical protein [Actinomycetota bacterium]
MRSTVQVNEVAALVPPLPTARTWKVCAPAANPEYAFVAGFVVPQSANAAPSNEHWNFVTEPESL